MDGDMPESSASTRDSQLRRVRHVLLLLVVILSGAAVAAGQKPRVVKPKSSLAPPSTTQAPTATHELTADDLGTFLEGLVPLQIEREDIAGAVVAVVKDGKLLFAHGYGYADAEKKKTVSAEDTLFRPGSVSKLFTWTSIMQLQEQRKLDLDHDVNEYIDFKVPQKFGKPVTIRNLMTHTPGFEEAVKDLFVANPSKPMSLGDYLKTHMPNEIYPPGTIPAYSNYGAAMAGYIVQRLSGEPFDQYVANHIFKPLGMTHATFTQPLPESLKPLMSNGSDAASDGAKSFEFVLPAPAGSLSAS